MEYNGDVSHGNDLSHDIKFEITVLKLSTPYILAANHFFLFPINAHNMLNTYIYHQFITSYLLHISVFVTPSSRRPLL
jgi:hypothetical protein